jgi:hypothetical protein
MLKRTKILALIAMTGSIFHFGGCSSGLFNGFGEGWFAKGFVNNWWVDVITDWLNEDLFG